MKAKELKRYRIEKSFNYGHSWNRFTDDEWLIVSRNNATLCVCSSEHAAKRICRLLNGEHKRR